MTFDDTKKNLNKGAYQRRSRVGSVCDDNDNKDGRVTHKGRSSLSRAA